jgi:N-acetylmuramic acid 6-phosphate etherase
LKKTASGPNLSRLSTERPNPVAADLDTKSAVEIARIINREDAKVASAVKQALPQIAKAIDLIANAFLHGGRLIYVGTGTSGRLGALDAAECPPTFNAPPRMVQYVLAGGLKALGRAVEADEDSPTFGEQEIARKKPRRGDVVVGIAASGRTPYTIAAVAYARRHGAKTIAVTCNRNTPIAKAAHLAIEVEVGPEVVSGSTRLKAGTAQKMVLNMLSTGAMARIGYVYGNLMVNLRLNNSKLAERGISVLQHATGVSREKARKLLQSAGDVRSAVVMLKTGANRKEAEQALKRSQGHVRQAISEARVLTSS